MNTPWPELSYQKGKDTFHTLHMFTQVVGKLKLTANPWLNHSWHVTLHIVPTGLSTLDMLAGDIHFQVDFDFISHRLKIFTSRGEYSDFSLKGISVADFYHKLFSILNGLGIQLKINPVPVEVVSAVPFEEDTVPAAYDEEHVTALHNALLKMKNIFLLYQGDFKGKSSPVHFFWGSFDLAVSRFSGRRAPRHPGGIPNLPDWVAEEAYSHEVTSCGFWPGSDAFPEPAFYAYMYPEPEGYKLATVQPSGAFYHNALSEFVLPYRVVQQCDKPEEALLAFLNSTYNEGASLAGWDRVSLEA